VPLNPPGGEAKDEPNAGPDLWERPPGRDQITAGQFERIYDPSIGESEPWYINDHCFTRDASSTWHLYGITHAEPFAPFDEIHFAHATAPDLRGAWTKQPFALTADPGCEEHHLWAPHVVEHDGRWFMFYCAGGPSKDRYRIHLATSADCWHWERHPDNPMVVDGFEARDPMVLRVGERWILYYTATSEPAGGHFVVAAAESTDLVHWSGRRIVYRDPLRGTMAGPTESPFVVAANGRYLLLIGPDWEGVIADYHRTGSPLGDAYRRTRVIASDDPLRFELANQVATIDAHAAEVIQTGAGSWVSHCGWGQGGVYLAPFEWRQDPS
jgi:arabinan endo-1,5-alpha-L-arabinosidase